MKYFKGILILLIMHSVSLVSAQPLSGTYTVGGTSPDYLSIASAANSVQLNGVSGPVIFNIRDGVYQGKITIYQFAGSSATNTVTFQSESADSTLVIISDSSSANQSANYTLQIFGADNIIFKQVTVQRAGTANYGTVIEIGNNSNNIKIQSCLLTTVTGAQNNINKCLIYTDSSALNQDIIIDNNRFLNGNFGIYKQSYTLESGNAITDNIFAGQYAAAIFADRQSGIIISRNTITATGVAAYRGIAVSRSVNGSVVNKNRISTGACTAGLLFTACQASSSNENIASNNFITIGGTTANSGISTVGSQNIRYIHNSVNCTGTNATSAAIAATGAGTSGLVIRNNIFVNTNGYAINMAVAGAMDGSDYNDFFTTGANIGSYGGTPAVDLAAWQALSGLDSNSININPGYVSATDLHVTSVGINDMGSGVGSVGTDIDGDTRSATTPDPGADEFTPLTDNFAVTELLSPSNYSCGDSVTTVSIVVQNLGLSSASSVPVTVEVTGSITQVFTDTIPGPLSTFDMDTITFNGSWNSYTGGVYNFKCYTSLAGDQDASDDTLMVTRTIIGIPSTPTAVSPQTYCEGNIGLTASTDSGNVLFWYDQPTGGNLLFSGDPFNPPVSSDTVFYVQAHSGVGSTGCLRITEMFLGTPDHLEIQNCSAAPVDVTGWVVAISNNYTNINAVNVNLWSLTSLGTINPGQIEYKTDGTVNPWGSNMLWNPGATMPGWAIIIDASGNVIDFASYGWSDAQLLTFNPIVNGFSITLGSEWGGSSIVPTCTGSNSLSRAGNSDNNTAADFSCVPATLNSTNPTLSLPFGNCGASLCHSDRIAVSLIVLPAPTVSLGPDIISATPVLLDPGAGYSSYLWNTGDITQTITADTSGLYVVTISDSTGCTASDSVMVTITTGIYENKNVTDVAIYPNPANGIVNLTFSCIRKQTVRIRLTDMIGHLIMQEELGLLEGRSIRSYDLESFSRGVYNLEILSEDAVMIKKIVLE